MVLAYLFGSLLDLARYSDDDFPRSRQDGLLKVVPWLVFPMGPLGEVIRDKTDRWRSLDQLLGFR